MAHECTHEEDFKRLEGMLAQIFSKMDSFLTDLRQAAVGEAKYQERVTQLRKDVDSMFDRLRTAEEAIVELQKWKSEVGGMIKVGVAVPSVLATILAMIQIAQLLSK